MMGLKLPLVNGPRRRDLAGRETGRGLGREEGQREKDRRGARGGGSHGSHPL